MPCVTDVGPTDIDIVFTTNGAKRKTNGSRNYLLLVKKDFENYNKIEGKFSPEKRQIVRNIVEALLPGRFMIEIEGQQGQWKVLSMKDAENRVMQRFCDERADRARKAKAAKKVSPKITNKKTPKINKGTKKAKATKKLSPKVNKTKKSCKNTNTNVSKAAKVATNTTPSTPNRGPTITRLNIVTPTSDYEKSFEPIELTGSPTSVAVPIYLTTPVVDVEKDLTSSDTLLATEGGVGDWPDDELLILRDLYPYNGE